MQVCMGAYMYVHQYVGVHGGHTSARVSQELEFQWLWVLVNKLRSPSRALSVLNC